MLKLVPDVAVPVGVGVGKVLVDKYKPTWSPWVGIGVAALSYGLNGFMGMGGDNLKNAGIASAPWAVEEIWGLLQGVGAARPMGAPVSRRITRYPAPAYTKEFQGVTLD